MRVFWLFLIYLIGILNSSAALAIAQVELGQAQRYDLSQQMVFIEDKDNRLSFSEVKNFKDEQWNRTRQGTTSFGYSDSSYWFKVRFVSTESQSWVVWLRYGLMDYVDFYWVQNGEVKQTNFTGDLRPYDSRSLKIFDFAISDRVEKGEQFEIYLRLKTEGSYKVSLEAWHQQGFQDHLVSHMIFRGLFYGVLFIMGLYNLVLYFVTGTRSYLFYIVYVFAGLATQIAVEGAGYKYFWPNYPALNLYATPLTFWAGIVGLWLFTYSFLDISKTDPKFKYFFIGIGLIHSSMVIGIFTLEYQTIVPVVTLFGVVVMVVASLASIVMTLMGHRHAGIFAIATLMSFVAYSLGMAQTIGGYDNSEMLRYGYPVARMFEVVLFALALGVRIRELESKKRKAESEAISQREENVRNIEQYQRLYDNAMTGNFLLNLDGSIIKSNTAFNKLLSFDINKPYFFQYFDDESKARLDKAKDIDYYTDQYDTQDLNGNWFSILINKIEEEGRYYFEGSLIDITDRVFAERLLVSSEEDKKRALQHLVVGVAHEINTPLGIVRTSSDLALENMKRVSDGIASNSLTKNEFIDLIDASKDALKLAGSNVLRMADLIKSFKEVSVQQMNFTVSEFDEKYFREALDSFSSSLGLDLIWHVKGDESSNFATFSDALFWIFSEFIQNCADHCIAKTKMNLSIHFEYESMTFIFSDQGGGVDEDSFTHIFDPFVTSKRGAQNKLGLGLYQVKNIVNQLLKSELKVSNEGGLKYEFTVHNFNKEGV